MTTAAARTLDTTDIDVATTLRPLGVHRSDPTHRRGAKWFAKAVLTPDGPGTILFTWNQGGATSCEAWGPGAPWLLEHAPSWVGLHDDPSGFDPSPNDRLRELWRRHRGIRLPAAGIVWQELALTILGQRVTTQSAMRSWVGLVRGWGSVAPGPLGLSMPPPPSALAERSYTELHRFGVERRRADALIAAARHAPRLEEAASMSAADAYQRLTALAGLGAWTATSVMSVCHADPDTVILRDYGLPTMVNYAFTGVTRRVPPDEGGDELMCQHLAPWRGHRRRVIRLLFAAGISVPSRSPRAFNPDIRRM